MKQTNLYKYLISILILGAGIPALAMEAMEKKVKSNTGLIDASKKGNLREVKKLLRSGADVNTKDEEGKTALMHAAQAAKEACVELLLQYGADHKLKDVHGNNACHYATWQTVSCLSNRLFVAACKGDIAAIHQFIQQGTNINQRKREWFVEEMNTENSNTPLIWAASRDRTRVLKCFLGHGADVNLENSKGDTALHLAARNGYLDAVRLLIQAGADLNKKNTSDYFTPLHLAVMFGHEEVVRCLLDAGASINQEAAYSNLSGRTALMLAIEGGNQRIIELLLRYGADVNKKTYSGGKQTALNMAARLKNLACCELIVEAMLGYTQIHRALFCLNNVEGNMFIDIREPILKRLGEGFCKDKVRKRISKLINQKIREHLLAKYFDNNN